MAAIYARKDALAKSNAWNLSQGEKQCIDNAYDNVYDLIGRHPVTLERRRTF